MQEKHANDLETLFPEIRHVDVGGRTLSVSHLKVRQLAAFAKVSSSFMHLIVTEDYLGAITHHTEDVCAAVSISTGADVAWLMDLDPDCLVTLASAVFEVNLGFFAKRLLPAKEAAGARMRELLTQLAGQPPSPGLSEEVTASPNAAS